MKALWVRWTAAAVLLGVATTAAAQYPGGGGRGRRGGVGRPPGMEVGKQIQALRAFPLEAMWTALCLGVDSTQALTDAQIAELRPGMQAAWKERREILSFARENEAWEVAAEKLEDLKKRTDQRLKAALTKDQWKAWERLVKEAAAGLRRGLFSGD